MANSTTTTPSSSSSSSSHAAFFYGTLMAPQVLHRVCHGDMDPSNPIYATHQLQTLPALLRHYRRHRVKGADYPAIVPARHSTVRGTYVTGLTDADIDRLDIFEGDEYERVRVRCYILPTEDDARDRRERLPEGVEAVVEADTYIWQSDPSALEDREWDLDEFRREKLKFWAGAEGEREYAEVDAAAAAAHEDKQQDGTRGRGANGHISRALKENQEKHKDSNASG